MKVIKPGTIVFMGDRGDHHPHMIVTGWTVHCTGEPPEDQDRAILVAAIRYLAARFSVTLDASPSEAFVVERQPAPENFDAQRSALDAIAVARWRDE